MPRPSSFVGRSQPWNKKRNHAPQRFRRLLAEMLENRDLLALTVNAFTELAPQGSLSASRTFTGSLSTTAAVEPFTATYDAGQTISVVANPSSTLDLGIRLLDEANSTVASISSTQVGKAAVLPPFQLNTAGSYRVEFFSSSGTGTFSGELLFNSVADRDTYTPAIVELNDTQVTAQNLDSTFIATGAGTSERGSVVGANASRTDYLYAWDDSSNVIREFNPTTGAIVRSISSSVTNSVDMGLAVAPNGLLVGGAGAIQELDISTGAVIRNITNPVTEVSGLAYLNGEIFVLDDSVGLRVLDYTTGGLVRSLSGFPTEGLTADGTRLIGVSGSATLVSINPATGTQTTLGVPTGVSTIEGLAFANGELFVAHSTSSLTVLDATSLAVKRSFTGFNNLEALGGDGIATGTLIDTVDWYRYSLGDGQTSSIHVSGISSATVPSFELYDAAGTLLGASVANAAGDQTLSGFRDSTINAARDDYFLKLTSLPTTGRYQVVVTRDIAFEAEPNNSPLLVQETTRVLGKVNNGIGNSTTLLTQFPGIGSSQTLCNCQPPDTHMAVGPNHVVEVVNTAIAIYNKNGTVAVAPRELKTFFNTSVVQGSLFDFDPVVTYDEIAGRWYVAELVATSSSALESDLMLAVSDTSDPTGPWSEQHRIDFSSVSPNLFVDYPKVGFNADALVYTFNMFNSSDTYTNIDILSINKSSLLDANPATLTRVITTRPSDNFTMAAATMHGSVAGDPMWFVQESGFGGTRNTIRVTRMDNPLSTTPVYTNFSVAVNSYISGSLGSIPQPGGTSFGRSDARMLNAEMRNNRLVAAHITGKATDSEETARWYEINVSNPAVPVLAQQGDIDPGSGVYTVYPSIAINAAGDLGITYMQASNTEFVSMYVAAQPFGAPAGFLSSPVRAKAGTATTTSGTRSGDYSGIGVDPVNGTFWAANEVIETSGFGWSTHIANFSASQIADDDFYAFNATAGDVLVLTTTTPFDGPGLPPNTLDPTLELYDPTGTLVATDTNSAADGRNAIITFNATASGRYVVRLVGASTLVQGAYTLNVTGNTGATALRVIDTDPDSGAKLSAFPLTMTLNFDRPVLVTSAQASDLLVGGLPATGVTMVDGNSLRFNVDPTANIGPGIYTVTLAAGAVLSAGGDPVDAFNGQFTLDTVGPRIVSTVWNGNPFTAAGVLAAGALAFDAQFNERVQLLASARRGLTAPGVDDATVRNRNTGISQNATAVRYDLPTETFHADFAALADGDYTLTLFSGTNAFEDEAGNDLDGEAIGPNPDGTLTGDGTPGGNYTRNFSVDAAVSPASFTRDETLGSFAARSTHIGTLYSSVDTDSYSFFAEAGQIISAVLSGTSATATTSLELEGISGPFLSALPGAPAVLPGILITATGQYQLRVAGDTASTYSLTILKNSHAEMESAGGSNNNLVASAENLPNTFFTPGSGMKVTNVSGTTTITTDTTDVYRLTLSDGEIATLNVKRQGASGTIGTQLLDVDGALIVNGLASTDSALVIENFRDTTSNGVPDTYYLRVSSTNTLSYTLSVVQSGTINRETNNSSSSAQSGQLAIGYLSSADSTDYYSFYVNAGDVLTLETDTPFDDIGGSPLNNLDPSLNLYAANGTTLLATDNNSASDGKNARINYTALTSGRLFARVNMQTVSTGEYLLRIMGSSILGSPLTVASTSPVLPAAVATPPTSITVNFSSSIRQDSIQATDLTVGGVPATGFTIVDADTVNFTLNTAAMATDGVYPVLIATDSITSVDGTGLTAYANNLTIDRQAPRILSTTWNGAALGASRIITAGAFTFTATFSEPLSTASLTTGDVVLTNTITSTTITASSLSYNAATNTVTIVFPSLAESTYRLQLTSGTLAFEDVVGNDLDGEATGSQADGTITGNGTTGGHYILNFESDLPTAPLTGFVRSSLTGSVVSRATAPTRYLNNAFDNDDFTFYISANHPISAVVTPAVGTATLSVEIVEIPGSRVTGVAGQLVVLPTTLAPTAGVYTLRVSGSGATNFLLEVNRNAEDERRVGDSSPANPINIAPTRLPEVSRYAVSGAASPTFSSLSFTKINNPALFVDISTTGTPLNISTDSSTTITSTVGNSFFPAGTVTVSGSGLMLSGTGFPSTEGTLPNSSFGKMLVPFWDPSCRYGKYLLEHTTS
jgi:methionine-rich copper-binding protein CopC